MTNSMCYFCKLIMVENFFCINRNFLIQNPLKKIGTCICILVPIIIISALVYDILIIKDLYLRAFQSVLLFELTVLVLAGRFRRNTFEAITRLDMKCGIDDKYFEQIKRKVMVVASVSVTSVFIDAIGLFLLDTRPSVIVVLVILFSAHDTEFAFIALLIDCMNLRLSNLIKQHPNAGCRIYRHILIVSSHINEEFTPRVLLMVGIILFTTSVYSFIIFLTDSTMAWKLSAYLIWRESKSLYSLWMACFAAARSQEICRRLAFDLSSRLGFDSSISKKKNPKLYKTVYRWYATVLSFRPRYVSGSILSINLVVPLSIIDISINYMIIILQFYVAYK